MLNGQPRAVVIVLIITIVITFVFVLDRRVQRRCCFHFFGRTPQEHVETR